MLRLSDGRPPVITDGFGSPRGATAVQAAHVHQGVDVMYARPGGNLPGKLRYPLPDHGSRGHEVPVGVPVVAAHAGRVWSTGTGLAGHHVTLDHGPEPWATFYQHLEQLAVPPHRHGKRLDGGPPLVVAAGDVLGTAGYSQADGQHIRHLHFELRSGGAAIDPRPTMQGWTVLASDAPSSAPLASGTGRPTPPASEGTMPNVVVKRTDARVPVEPDPKGFAYVVKRGFTADHQAVDLELPAGYPVVAPEDGTVWVAADRNDVPGFVGMGPAFVYLRGDSGMFHLLAELGGVARTAGHVSRSALHPGEDDQYIITLGTDYHVHKGEVLGVGGAHGIVHWAMSPAPITKTTEGGANAYYLVAAEKMDPLAWLDEVTRTVDTMPVADAGGGDRDQGSGGGGGGGLGLLVVGYFVGRELRWW
jgi:murein DD-endopeptidase MepM/ murein hydrolase activator NlpD